ncbi:hypothetical protein AUJ84_04475 [Candidatus Pacearchaeota archaeon CG1_02_32_132]|nr:MAG: hypothetical protein AUJ84_04475 [Candidatus Pacearchaeota archaeon CG1_02_32_132]
MAEVVKLEREYTIPLRSKWMNKPSYKRTRASVMAIKKFIARHMKIVDRDEKKVKIDRYLNNELWFRGAKTPFSKIKVIARRDGENVIVELAEMPEKLKFAKIKDERRHKKDDKKKEKAERPEDKIEKTEEEKKEEKEKAKSVAIAGEKQAEMQAKEQKHMTKLKTPQIKRMALKK